MYHEMRDPDRRTAEAVDDSKNLLNAKNQITMRNDACKSYRNRDPKAWHGMTEQHKIAESIKDILEMHTEPPYGCHDIYH